MKTYLLDTNAISEPQKKHPNEAFERWLKSVDTWQLHTSCLVVGEITKGINLQANAASKQKLEDWLSDTLRNFNDRIQNLDLPTCILWGKLVSLAQKRGHTVPMVDSLLAAQCIKNDLVLVTRNVKDFDQFPDLQILCPWG